MSAHKIKCVKKRTKENQLLLLIFQTTTCIVKPKSNHEKKIRIARVPSVKGTNPTKKETNKQTDEHTMMLFKHAWTSTWMIHWLIGFATIGQELYRLILSFFATKKQKFYKYRLWVVWFKTPRIKYATFSSTFHSNLREKNSDSGLFVFEKIIRPQMIKHQGTSMVLDGMQKKNHFVCQFWPKTYDFCTKVLC